MSEHKEKHVRVNAWVDEGVAPLVEALNVFDHALVTVESCQETEDGWAEVMFTTADPDEVISMARRLAAAVEGWQQAVVSVTWWHGSDTPLAALRCDPDQVGTVARLVSGWRPEVDER